VAVVTAAFYQAALLVTSAAILEPFLLGDTNVTADPESFGSFPSPPKITVEPCTFSRNLVVRHNLTVTHRDLCANPPLLCHTLRTKTSFERPKAVPKFRRGYIEGFAICPIT
jgi:hypothetical protein